MKNQMFKAMVVRETSHEKFERGITEKSVIDLPAGDVLIKVAYSSLNYKDALSASGNKGVTKNYPHTPGIDAAGTVAECRTDAFAPGDRVIVTSYDLGMNTDGGFGEYIRVPAEWVVRLPETLTLKESMIFGTAGLTAGLSVYKLTHTLTPDRGDILVSGASGGVGSMAVSILVQSGYAVVGVSGKIEEKEFLQALGVKEIISREEAADYSGRPILTERWAGVIDTVGGEILATAIKSTRLNGNITCCGNVASPELPLTVFPFILRGISLYGIDSQHCPMSTRIKIWEKLAGEWKLKNLDALASEITLEDLDERITRMLAGESRGRTVIKI